ncbi:hypothetical protein NFI96_001533 [Prochilodus magdalenae]|nr:hypothetical protein NFI96_001533 [Prochilodus magdalenae]
MRSKGNTKAALPKGSPAAQVPALAPWSGSVRAHVHSFQNYCGAYQPLEKDTHSCTTISRLQECNLTDKSCEALATALRNSSCIRELDLSKNDLQDAKIRLLSAVLENPCCKLEILRLEHSNVTKEGWLTLFKALRSNPSHLRELNLSNILLFSGITELCAFLGDPSCRLEKLHLEYCSIRDEGCADLINALKSNPSSHLRELNLSWNDPGKSGVKQFSDLLDDSQCKLEKLQLASCNITCGDCVTLVKALKSNPSSHLRELNLSNNLLGHSGAKELSDLLKDPLCKLEKLQIEEAILRLG